MALKPPDEQELIRGQQELKDKFLADPATVSVANAAQVAMLVDDITLEYPNGSGNLFRVPSVPYRDGLEIYDLHVRLLDSRKYTDNHLLPVYQRQLKRILDIAWTLMVPVSWKDRLLKRFGLLRNPLYHASEGDAADILGFFLVRRMKSNVKFRYPPTDKKATTA